MSSLAHALGSHAVGDTSSLLVNLSRHTQDSASRWYYATTCELRQHKYNAQSPYDPEPDVTFLDQAGNIIPLRVMLDPRFSMPQWDHPWTKSEGVGQKITIRVLVSGGAHEIILCSHSPKLGTKFAKTFNARRETNTREAKSKNKLAQEVARATADALHVRAILAVELAV